MISTCKNDGVVTHTRLKIDTLEFMNSARILNCYNIESQLTCVTSMRFSILEVKIKRVSSSFCPTRRYLPPSSCPQILSSGSGTHWVLRSHLVSAGSRSLTHSHRHHFWTSTCHPCRALATYRSPFCSGALRNFLH